MRRMKAPPGCVYLPSLQRLPVAGSRGRRGPQLVAAVGPRVLVEEERPAGRGEALDVAHGPRAARRPDPGPVAEPLPPAQIGTARQPAALLVVLLERRAPVVQAEPPATGIRHGGGEPRGEAIPAPAGGEHATA